MPEFAITLDRVQAAQRPGHPFGIAIYADRSAV
jgi:hypothetical protein